MESVDDSDRIAAFGSIILSKTEAVTVFQL